MGKCEAKAIQANLGKFKHISAYSGIIRNIQAYSEQEAYSEPAFRNIVPKVI